MEAAQVGGQLYTWEVDSFVQSLLDSRRYAGCGADVCGYERFATRTAGATIYSNAISERYCTLRSGRQTLHQWYFRVDSIWTERQEQTFHPQGSQRAHQVLSAREQFCMATRCRYGAAHLQCRGTACAAKTEWIAQSIQVVPKRRGSFGIAVRRRYSAEDTARRRKYQ